MARILIIDDNKQLRILLSETLKQYKHETETASDGIEGLEKAKEDAFDLIITDLMMPNMDGIEFIRTLRTTNAEVGIIAVSGGDTPAVTPALETARMMGANASLAKPFKRRQLIEMVNSVLTQAKTKNQPPNT
jgi:two-component system chemotaxis response regulator CheY